MTAARAMSATEYRAKARGALNLAALEATPEGKREWVHLAQAYANLATKAELDDVRN